MEDDTTQVLPDFRLVAEQAHADVTEWIEQYPATEQAETIFTGYHETMRQEQAGWIAPETAIRELLNWRQQARRSLQSEFNRQQAEKRRQAQPPQVDTEEPREEPSKPRKLRPDRANNERRMRETLLQDDKLKPNGWTGSGERKLARQAKMPRSTARDTLDRMEVDEQIERDKRIGKRGRRHGFRIRLEHLAWSDPKLVHLLALSPLSPQVNSESRPSLVTYK
jgi:hypothetical protein